MIGQCFICNMDETLFLSHFIVMKIKPFRGKNTSYLHEKIHILDI